MAISIGTTSRQLRSVARWSLIVVFALGMFAWSRPGYYAWGCLAGGLLAVLAIWMLARTVAGDRTVPVHPLQLVILTVGIIVSYHLSSNTLGISNSGDDLAGAMDMSMLFHLLLLVLAVMLSQELFASVRKSILLPTVLGLSMMAGSGFGLLTGNPLNRLSLTLLGLAGVCVWLSPIGQLNEHRAIAGFETLRLRVARIAWPIVAIVVAACFIVSAGAGIVAGDFDAQLFGPTPAGAIGLGGNGFTSVWAGDNGLVVLGQSAGWIGLALAVGGCLASLVYMLARASWPLGRAAKVRPLLWIAAALFAGGAFICPGGWSSPAITFAVAVTWAALPAVLARPVRSVSGWILVAVLVGFMLLLGLAKKLGLVSWIARAHGLDDTFMHIMAGFWLAISLAWLVGGRQWWAGLLGIAFAALAGGAGEALQIILSRRTAQISDWQAHALGSAIVILPYLLAMGSRWCESGDATGKLETEFVDS